MKLLYCPFDFRLKKFNKVPERLFNIETRVRNKVLYLVKAEKKDYPNLSPPSFFRLVGKEFIY